VKFTQFFDRLKFLEGWSKRAEKTEKGRGRRTLAKGLEMGREIGFLGNYA
jgi:hypothetical protein